MLDRDCALDAMVIDGLSVGYARHAVAERLSAHLSAGTLTALVGPNGMGKSTLLRTLAGVQKPLAGAVRLVGGGTDCCVHRLSRSELSRWISVVLTDKVEVEHLTVEEVVAFGRMPYTGYFGRLSDDDRRLVAEALHATALTPLAHRNVDTLSDGERQKMMIAKALAQQTPVMLLDEPTAFLDYPSKVETLKLLGRLAHETGKIIVLSTHDLHLALRLADRLLTFGKGLEEVDKNSLRQRLDRIAD